jgi:nicotinamidase-related amidase
MPLIDRADSILIVVDAQPGFSGGTEEEAAAAVRSREVAGWLAGVATALDVPIVVTEEDAAANGATDAVIVDRLSANTPILPKPVFGLADVREILSAIVATGRRTAVIVGAETDVCVAQSAIGLHDRAFRVVVVADATFSPGAMHEFGLQQLRDNGIDVRHAKGIFYDWMRTLESVRAFVAEHPDLATPPGFRL